MVTSTEVSGTGNCVFRADGTTGAPIDDCFAGPGSPLNYATGLTFGPDGNLYVGSFFGNQVLRFDGTTGDVHRRIRDRTDRWQRWERRRSDVRT